MSVRSSSPRSGGGVAGLTGPAVSRHQAPGLDLTLLQRHSFQELHLTLRPLAGETLAALCGRLREALTPHGMTVVRQEIFGALTARQGTLRALRQACGPVRWPITWLDGADCRGGRLAGMHVTAVRGAAVAPVYVDRQRVGSCYHDGAARHCWLGNVSPANRDRSPGEQSRRAYADIDAALKQAGMDATHVVRTWFYLDDILDWYGKFNGVRADYFRRRKIFDHLVPASTGVGARNPAGAALAIGAWAIQPVTEGVSVREVVSPLQCPAPSYGSSFSRAVEITTPNYRHLLISGTASIEPGGRSVHGGDIAAQVNLTMRVVEGILASCTMSFADVIRGSAYYKYPKDAAAFANWCCRQQISSLPVINTRADVCRDELLFEIEMDAVIPWSGKPRLQTPRARPVS